MVLRFNLDVKFRIFGVTIGTVSKKFEFPLKSAVEALLAGAIVEKLKVDERGVKLSAEVV